MASPDAAAGYGAADESAATPVFALPAACPQVSFAEPDCLKTAFSLRGSPQTAAKKACSVAALAGSATSSTETSPPSTTDPASHAVARATFQAGVAQPAEIIAGAEAAAVFGAAS